MDREFETIEVAEAKPGIVVVTLNRPDKGNGGAWFLPRLVGSGRAAELVLTGDLISAGEALQMGLVNRVVEPDELLPAALSIAERIAANPWRAVEAAKQALRASWQQDLAGALNFGYWTAGALHWTSDFQERVAGFVERKAKEPGGPGVSQVMRRGS